MKEGYKKTELGEIPNEWKVCLLSDVAEINPKKEVLEADENVSFLSMEQVSNSGRILNIDLRRYEDVSKGYTPFKNNDVLLAKITPCFENGKRALVKNLNTKIGFGSTEFHVLRNIEQESISEYLYYCISAHRLRELAKLNMTGSAGQKRVPTTFLKDYKLVVPPLKEQEKIAEILSTVDSQIDDTSMLIEKCKELKKGLMQRLLTKGIGHKSFKKTEVGEIPNSWEVKKLGEIANIRRGASPRPIKDPKWFSNKNDIGWVRISDVTSSAKYLFNTSQYLSEEGKSKSRPVHEGDLIMSICATVGKPIIMKMNACIHDGFVLLDEINEESYDREFLYYVLQRYEENFKSMGQTGTQSNLNTELVGGLKVAVPTIIEQKKISELVSTVDTNIEEYEKKKQKLEEIKKGLMQQLLTGKIRSI